MTTDHPRRRLGLVAGASTGIGKALARVRARGAETIDLDDVRRGGTVSISGVYGGAADPNAQLQLLGHRQQNRHGRAPWD